jgi:molybdopterin-binding protein
MQKEIIDVVKPIGSVQAIITYESGEQKILEFPNAVLNKGREALAACLARALGEGFNFYVNRMLFGDGGTAGGTTKYVSASRNGLFGITQASKPVIASVDPNIPSQVIFTSVISYSEANGAVLSEMALQLATGDLYSMVTFPDLTKTPQMQIVWNWRLSFV